MGAEGINYTRKYLLGAPKVKRTHCYIQKPISYDIVCPLCGKGNITWSEFETHIWCYSCEQDVYVPLNESGIFSGPIPWQMTHMLGINFGRINLETHAILEDTGAPPGEVENALKEFGETFVYSKELREYELLEEANRIEDDPSS